MPNNALLEQAIADLNTQETPNYYATARKYGVNNNTLKNRFTGKTASKSDGHLETQGNLSSAEERILLDRISFLTDKGIPPTPQFLRNLVAEMTDKPIGDHWIGRFCGRHKNAIKSVYIETIDHARHVADHVRHFEHYFSQLAEKVFKYRITRGNTYNMDEKGFLIGLCSILKRTVARKQLESGKMLGASQDGSREFLSLLACICADGTALPPALIYTGKTGDLQDTWLEDFDHSSEEAYFSSSPKGWTNDKLGVSWLKTIFLRHTTPKAGNNWRLLIVDGHSSHVNMKFVKVCDENKIVLAVLPPHSTHRLQPLDLKIFSPLQTAYSRNIDLFLSKSMGLCRLTKRNFWSIFRASWEKALTPSNICSGFAAAGIYPLKPEKVLDIFKTRSPSPTPKAGEAPSKTPSSSKAVRRHVKQLRLEGALKDKRMDLLARAAQKLAISNDILEHENAGLREALIEEQKRRKRGKKMGLVDKDEPGQAVFFSPAKVAEARAKQKALETQQEDEKLRKEQEKARKATEKERKAREAQERAEKKKKAAAEKKELADQLKRGRQARKQLEADLQIEELALEMVRRPLKRLQKPRDKPVLGIEEKRLKAGITRRGRVIAAPKRFRS